MTPDVAVVIPLNNPACVCLHACVGSVCAREGVCVRVRVRVGVGLRGFVRVCVWVGGVGFVKSKSKSNQIKTKINQSKSKHQRSQLPPSVFMPEHSLPHHSTQDPTDHS